MTHVRTDGQRNPTYLRVARAAVIVAVVIVATLHPTWAAVKGTARVVDDAADVTGSCNTDVVYVLKDDTNNGKHYCCVSGTWAACDQGAGGGGTPGGTDTQVQYNSSSSFAGDAGLTYNAGTDTLTVAGEVVTKNLNGARVLSQYATGGAGTSGDPWTGWASAFAADTTIIAPEGYYEAPDTATTLPDGTYLSCEHGATFQWQSGTRSGVDDLFEITAADADVTIDGCSFEAGVVIPAGGLATGADPGGDFIQVGAEASSTGPGTVVIRGCRFGPARFGSNADFSAGPFSRSIRYATVRNLLVLGNVFDGATENVMGHTGHATAQYTSESIQVIGNVFDWQTAPDDSLGTIAFGSANLATVQQHADKVLIVGNVASNFTGAFVYQPFDIDQIVISGNIANSDTMDLCIFLDPPQGAVDRITVTNNQCLTVTGYNAKITAADFTFANLSGNTVAGGLADITASSATVGSSARIVGNAITDVDGTNSGGSCVAATADHNRVSDNTCTDFDSIADRDSSYVSWEVTGNTLIETGGEVVSQTCPANASADWAVLTGNTINNTTPANGSFTAADSATAECDVIHSNRSIGATVTDNDFKVGDLTESLKLYQFLEATGDVRVYTGSKSDAAELTVHNPLDSGGAEASFWMNLGQIGSESYSIEHELVVDSFAVKNAISGNTLESWDLTTDLKTVAGGLAYAPDRTNVTSVRAYDYDGDGTFEMTDLQSIVTAYGADTRIIVPAGNWVAPDDSANTGGVLEVTANDVHIECERGAILNGPKRYASQQDDGAAGNNAAFLTDVNASFGTLTGYTLINWTDGSKCTVTSNTGTTATCTLQAGVAATDCTAADQPYDGCTGSGTGSGLGTDTDWDDNDYYALWIDELRGVYFNGTTDVSIRGCEVDYGLPDATADATVNLMPFPIQPSMAISCIGCNRFWIQDNHVHDTAHSGIYGADADNGVVTGNIIERAGRYGTNGGAHNVLTVQNAIQFYTDGTADGLTQNILLAGNTVRNYTASCIKFRRESTSETTKNHRVVGNACINADVELAGATDCINLMSVDGGIAADNLCINAPFHINGASDFLASGANAQKNITYSGFRVDNSTATVAVDDMVIGELAAENVTIEDFYVVSQGGGYCLNMDPPWQGLTLRDVTFDGCAYSLGAWAVTNVSATDHAIGGSGSCSDSTCSTGVTENEAYDLRVDGMTFIDASAGSIGRFLGDVPWFGADIQGLRIVNNSGTGDVMRWLTDGTNDYPVKDLTVSNAIIDTATTADVFDFEDTGSAQDFTNLRFVDVVASDLGGYLIDWEGGDTLDNLLLANIELRGSGVDGLIDTAGLATVTDVRRRETHCPDTTYGCADRGTVYKSADESRTADTTLSNDSDLVVPVEAGGQYRAKFYVYFNTSTAPDIKFSIACPTSSDINITSTWYEANATEVNGRAPRSFCGFSDSVLNTTDGWFWYEVWVNVTTAGNVTLQWAQDTSDAASTSVLAGSYATWERLN